MHYLQKVTSHNCNKSFDNLLEVREQRNHHTQRFAWNGPQNPVIQNGHLAGFESLQAFIFQMAFNIYNQQQHWAGYNQVLSTEGSTTKQTSNKTQVHREIVPPRETVVIAIVGRGGWGSLPYTVANENQMKAQTTLRMVPSTTCPSLCYKVTDDTFSNIVEDQIICQSMLEI